MKVHELIHRLQGYDQNAEVEFEYWEYGDDINTIDILRQKETTMIRILDGKVILS